jgi:transposase
VVEARLDGALGDLEDIGDRGLTQVGLVAQHDDLGLAAREPPDGVPQLGVVSGQLDLLVASQTNLLSQQAPLTKKALSPSPLPVKRGSPVPVTWSSPWRQHRGMRPTAYRRNARGLRDRQAFEHVRMQAGVLFAAGRSQAEVARTLGVARQNVSRWHARWRHGGLQALASRGPTGPSPRLSDQQRQALEGALRQGARAHGFDTDHWTLARITTVIQRLTGVAFHPGHTWKLLRRMGWRLQRPARRAVERDEQAIARWLAEDWP